MINLCLNGYQAEISDITKALNTIKNYSETIPVTNATIELNGLQYRIDRQTGGKYSVCVRCNGCTIISYNNVENINDIFIPQYPQNTTEFLMKRGLNNGNRLQTGD